MIVTEVVLLATLHHLHSEVRGYSFEELGHLVTKLEPAALVVELQSSEIAGFPENPIKGSKVEYNKSILPTAQKLKLPVYALEPSGKERDEILKVYEKAWKDAAKNPSYEAFSKYTDLLFSQLMRYWQGPLDVNSEVTIESFRLKHSYQEALLSVDTPSWEQWNEHFLESILATADIHRGKRLVVTVGAEHVYWLKDRLSKKSEVRLISLSEAL